MLRYGTITPLCRLLKEADKNRRYFEFAIGDIVFVKLHSLALRKNQKLGMRCFGPFEIMERIGAVAYKLNLPSSAFIHPALHVSVLRPFKGDASQPYMPFSPLTNEKGPLLQPITVFSNLGRCSSDITALPQIQS